MKFKKLPKNNFHFVPWNEAGQTKGGHINHVPEYHITRHCWASADGFWAR